MFQMAFPFKDLNGKTIRAFPLIFLALPGLR
jgi:hypothetical protein